MLRKSYSIILAVCLSVAIAGCHGSKYFTKVGAKQEAAGLTPEAAESRTPDDRHPLLAQDESRGCVISVKESGSGYAPRRSVVRMAHLRGVR